MINTGWIPGYLQRCGEMLREHYKNKHSRQTLSETEFKCPLETVGMNGEFVDTCMGRTIPE